MNLLNLLAQLLGIVSLLSFIWLLVRAFSRHFLWGLGVLLLSPFSALAFGVTYWNDEKKPLIAYLGSTLCAVGLMFYLFNAWGGWELVDATRRVQQGIIKQELTEQDAEMFMQASQRFVENSGVEVRDPALMAMLEEMQEREQQQEREATFQAELEALTARAEPAEPPINRKVKSTEATRYRLAYKTISLDDARNYVGGTVKVTRRNVEEKEYRLTGVTNTSLQLSQRASGGSYSFSYRKRDIEKLRVLIKEPY